MLPTTGATRSTVARTAAHATADSIRCCDRLGVVSRHEGIAVTTGQTGSADNHRSTIIGDRGHIEGGDSLPVTADSHGAVGSHRACRADDTL